MLRYLVAGNPPNRIAFFETIKQRFRIRFQRNWQRRFIKIRKAHTLYFKIIIKVSFKKRQENTSKKKKWKPSTWVFGNGKVRSTRNFPKPVINTDSFINCLIRRHACQEYLLSTAESLTNHKVSITYVTKYSRRGFWE